MHSNEQQKRPATQKNRIKKIEKFPLRFFKVKRPSYCIFSGTFFHFDLATDK